MGPRDLLGSASALLLKEPGCVFKLIFFNYFKKRFWTFKHAFELFCGVAEQPKVGLEELC